jgi:sulfur carrier protein ThiS
MDRMLTIRLEVYLPFRGERIWRGAESVAAGATLASLTQGLALGEPDLAVLLNGRCMPGETQLKEGDEVAILRQAEGG